MSDKRPTIEVHAEVPTPDAVRTFYEVPDAVASQIGVLDHKASFVENLVSLLAGKAYAVEAVNVAAIHHVDKMRDLRDQHNSETRKDCESGCDTHRTCREDRGPCTPAAWVEAECENERLRAALEKIADDERERIVAKLRFFGFPVAATMVEGDA